MFDSKKIKQDFPFFNNNAKLIYLDNSGTTLKPQSVINGINDYYTKFSTNPHNLDFALSYTCNEHITRTRKIVAEFINANEKEIVFIPSSTYGINSLAWGLKSLVSKGDEILLTNAEHSSNLLPWLWLSKNSGSSIKDIPLENYEITVSNVQKMLTKKTKIVSFANISNVFGAVNDVAKITKAIKQYNPNIIIIIDAAQSISCIKTDVSLWGIDFLVFSAHKMLGPTGIGILWGKTQLLQRLDPLLLGGGSNVVITQKQDYYWPLDNNPLEAGTLNVAGIFGLYEAVKYLQLLGIENICKYIIELKQYAIKSIEKAKLDITIYNPEAKSGILLFNVNNVAAHDVSAYLANQHNICLRSGQHCSPLTKNVIDTKSTLRASFYIYNTKDDVDQLVAALKNGGNFLGDIW